MGATLVIASLSWTNTGDVDIGYRHGEQWTGDREQGTGYAAEVEWGRHFRDLFRHDQWGVGVVEAPISAFLDAAFEPSVRWLTSLRRRGFYADPFGVVGDEGLEIFCEAWDARRGRGHLVKLGKDGEAEPQLGFPAEVHLSYPFLVEEEGELYCVPESCEAGEVCLYQRQGRQWVYAATLLPGFAGVDATLFRHLDRWWMACTCRSADPNAELFLFHAQRLRGPWMAHRQNPVKRDVRSSRPAGTPFMYESQLYRPAQDCSETYGGAVVINHILRLTPHEFIEREVARWTPPREWRLRRGWHTLSSVGNITLVDGKRVTFLPGEFRREAARKLRRVLGR